MATQKDEFAARLVQARSMKGWSQVDVANASGVAAAQISRYEQGSNTPRPQVVAKLAAALGVSFSWLLTGAGEPVDSWLAGRATLRVELPTEVIRRIEQSASQNRRLVDEEVQARLQASFDEDLPDRTAELLLNGEIGATVKSVNNAMRHLALLSKRLQMEGLDLVSSGQATAVVTRPDGSIAPFEPPQAPVAEPPASKGPVSSRNKRPT